MDEASQSISTFPMLMEFAVVIKDFVSPQRYKRIASYEDISLSHFASILFGSAGLECPSGSGQIAVYDHLDSVVFSIMDEDTETTPLSLLGEVHVAFPELPFQIWRQLFVDAQRVALRDEDLCEDARSYVSHVRGQYMLSSVQDDERQLMKEDLNIALLKPKALVIGGHGRAEIANQQSHRSRIVLDTLICTELSDVIELNSQSTLGKLWRFASCEGLLPVQMTVKGGSYGRRQVPWQRGVTCREFFGGFPSIIEVTGALHGGAKKARMDAAGQSNAGGSADAGGANSGGASATGDANSTGEGIHLYSLDEMYTLSFYEILNVDPGAHSRAITVNYRKLAKLVHPDKGGNAMQFLVVKFIYDVLSNEVTRSEYDINPDYFRSRMPRATADCPSSQVPPANGGASVYTEFLNKDFALRCLQLKGLGKLFHGSMSFREVIMTFLTRSTYDSTKKAYHFRAFWHESGRCKEMGLSGRRIPGMESGFALEEVGAFPFAKLIRYILRGGFGERLQDHDQVNAFFARLLNILADWGMTEIFPMVSNMVYKRSGMFDMMEEFMHGDHDKIKVAFLACLFQAKLPEGAPDGFVRLDAEVKRFYDTVQERRPQLVEIARSWGKKRPAICAGAYLLMDSERQKLDVKTDIAADALMSPEADGMVTFDATDEQIEKIYEGPIEMVRKPYPQTVEDVAAFAKKRYPHIDWNSMSKFNWQEVLEALRCIRNDLDGEAECKMSGHTDYALVIAAFNEGQLTLEGDTLCYVNGNFWRVSSAKDALHSVVRTEMKRIFGFKAMSYTKGKMSMSNPFSCPKSFKDHGFLVSVREELKAYIVGCAPKLNQKRELLAFADGTVYDFAQNTAFKVHPELHISRHVPFAYSEGDVLANAKWCELVAEVIQFWKGGGKDLEPDMTEGIAFGKADLAEKVRDFARQNPFLTIILDISNNNVDEMLYLLQHMCRMMSAYPRLCELLYIHGAKKAGKDVIGLLLQTFFGDVDDDGFCATLPGDYFIAGTKKRSNEDSMPMIHSIRDARCVLMPEVPAGVFDMHAIKPFLRTVGRQDGYSYT